MSGDIAETGHATVSVGHGVSDIDLQLAGSVTVHGALTTSSGGGGSLTVLGGSLTVTKRLTLDDANSNIGFGSTVNAAGGLTIGAQTGSKGELFVYTSSLKTGSANIGDGGDGLLQLQDGASFVNPASTLILGRLAGSRGRLLVNAFSDSAAQVEVGNATVGGVGSGEFRIDNDGTAIVHGDLIVGGFRGVVFAAGGGSLEVTGNVTLGKTSSATDAHLTVQGKSASTGRATRFSWGGAFELGLRGIGSFDVHDGGFASGQKLFVGRYGAGSVLVDGTGAQLEATTLTLGGAVGQRDDCDRWTYPNGGSGSLTVFNDGHVKIAKTLTLHDPRSAAKTLFVTSGGRVDIGAGAGSAGSNELFIHSDGHLVGHGIINVGTVDGVADVQNDGTIRAEEGTLLIRSDVDSSGKTEIDDGATLELDGGFDGTVDFMAGRNVLRLDSPDLFHGKISGLELGDTIAISADALRQWTGFAAPVVAHTQLAGGQLRITINDFGPAKQTTVKVFDVAGALAGSSFIIRDLNGNAATPVTDVALTLATSNPDIKTGAAGRGYGNDYTDSLVNGWAAWDVSKGPIKFWFGSQTDLHDAIDRHGETQDLSCDSTVSTWTGAQMMVFQKALADVEAISGLRFASATSASAADIIWWLAPPGPGVAGRAEFPSRVPGAQVWSVFDPGYLTRWPGFGGESAYLVHHELGHILGLAHPDLGGYEANRTGFPDATQNQGVFTALSYDRGWKGTPQTGQDFGAQGAFGALDIAALQKLYGPTAHNAGDNAYTLPTQNRIGTGYSTIWDTSGIDRISAPSTTLFDCTIDLRPAPLTGSNAGGYVSHVDNIQGGFTIANGVLIENTFAGDGDDTIVGNDLDNTIIARGGEDDVRAGLGADKVFGGEGLDHLLGEGGDDHLLGDAGDDTMVGGAGKDVLEGEDGDDVIEGGDDDDVLRGGEGDDRLNGDSGNDRIQGDDGHDVLRGSEGSDSLFGGLGADILYGAAGNDRFTVGSVAESSVSAFDQIKDWDPGDKIILSAIDANTKVAGDQAFTFIGAAAFSAAGQLRVTTGSNTIVTGDIDGDGAADFKILLAGAQTLSAASFAL